MTTEQTPRAFILEHQPLISQNWQSGLNLFLQHVMPIIFPGIPFSAALAWTAKSGGGHQAIVRDGINLLGYFMVPAGPSSSPQIPAATDLNNDWRTLANSELVRAILRRPGVTEPNAWKTHIEDQTVIGLIYMRSLYVRVVQLLAPNVRDVMEMDTRIPIRNPTNWDVAVIVLAQWFGPERTAQFIRTYVHSLAIVPADKRLGELVTLVPTYGTPEEARMVLRACQYVMLGWSMAFQGINSNTFYTFFQANITEPQKTYLFDKLVEKANAPTPVATTNTQLTTSTQPVSQNWTTTHTVAAVAGVGLLWWAAKAKNLL